MRVSVLAVLLVVSAPFAGAQGLDIIRGQVISAEGRPIGEATITATSARGGVNRTTRADPDGRYTITFPGGEGHYFMVFTAVGFIPKRIELRRVVDEDILVADAQMRPAPAVLDTVHVAANRQRVARTDRRQPDMSGTEQAAVRSALPADQQGDLMDLATTIPGATAVFGSDGDPAGFSVLGLPLDQNSITLNGLAFGGSNLPRDASFSASLVTTPYDVSRGGFSGAQFNVQPAAGSNFIRRTTSLNAAAASLHRADAVARSLGQQYSNLSVGGLISGPIVFDRAFYNVSYQLGRRTNDLRTLVNTDPIGLQASGIAPDSAYTLLAILREKNIPITRSGGVASDRVSDDAAVFGTIDFSAPNSRTSQTVNLTFNGALRRLVPASQAVSEVPTYNGQRRDWNVGAQLTHSAYLNGILLSETTVDATSASSGSTPYLRLPSGSVLVRSTFPDGTSAIRQLAFGGSPTFGSSSRQSALGARNQLSWFSKNNAHRIKVTAEARWLVDANDHSRNQLGSFGYNSLADLDADRPASFTRALVPRVQHASQEVFAFAIGDSYRRTRNLQLQYGLRVDANRFSTRPAYNPDVYSVFGVRNDATPNRVYFSPRVGFSWAYGADGQIAAFEGAARSPRAVVRGGVGVFQNVPPVSLLSSAIDNTGLAVGVQQVSCVGEAVPLPDWSAFMTDPDTAPTQCADGTSGSAFGSIVPNVNLFSERFVAPRSVRANVQWSGRILSNRMSATIEGIYSHNLNQPSFVDLNFAPTVRFTLPGESERPVFANASSIVPETGASTSRDSRISPLFSSVTEQRSDLISQSRQLRLTVGPSSPSSRSTWGASYVMSSNRAQFRDFVSTENGAIDIAWAPSAFDSRHQMTLHAGYSFFDAVRVIWFARLASGTAYTPMVGGDINGDGQFNDRAYIFAPGDYNDDSAAAAMGRLMADAPRSVRACLANQLRSVAARNSCRGPWTANTNMTILLNPTRIRLPQRVALAFSITNPLAAVDLALHGGRSLRGWGGAAVPDQTLLFVRGFDPAARRFKYDVNPRFGSGNPQFKALRNPVSLTVSLRVDLGPSRERQIITQQLDRGRRTGGERLSSAMIKAMYGTSGILNPIAQLLLNADTLELSGAQADSFAAMNVAYTAALDSIWTEVAQELAHLPIQYDRGAAFKRYRNAREASVDLLVDLAPRVTKLLTDAQKRKLAPVIAMHLDRRYLRSVRSGTEGNSGTNAFAGGVYSPGSAGDVTYTRIDIINGVRQP